MNCNFKNNKILFLIKILFLLMLINIVIVKFIFLNIIILIIIFVYIILGYRIIILNIIKWGIGLIYIIFCDKGNEILIIFKLMYI